MTARFRTLSQAPQAVRSAGGRRWGWAFPSGARAGRTLQADECNAVGLTVHVHRLRNKSTTAAIRAVVRSHSSPPSVLGALSTKQARNFRQNVLRYESRTRFERTTGIFHRLARIVCSDSRESRPGEIINHRLRRARAGNQGRELNETCHRTRIYNSSSSGAGPIGPFQLSLFCGRSTS
jgi:hypothetical protein